MDLRAVLTNAKASAAAAVAPLLTDTAVITRDIEGTGDDVFDENTGQYTTPDGDTTSVYEGPALVTAMSGTDTDPDGAGGVAWYPQRYRARIDAATDAVRIGDRFRVTDSDDPHLAGREFLVVDVLDAGHQITQRLTLEARDRGPRR
jgi:hypothetical protein